MKHKHRILAIVEDDVDLADLLRVLLSDERIEFGPTARSAEEAFEICRDLNPELIILDHMLPGMSGLDAAPHFKKLAPECQILIFSALDLKKESDASSDVDAFLSKTEIKKLPAKVYEMLDMKALDPFS